MYKSHHRILLPKSHKTHNSKVLDQDISPEQRQGEKSTHESSTKPGPARPPMAVPYHNPRDQSCHGGKTEEAIKAAPGAFLAAEFIPRRPRQGRTGPSGRHWQLRNGISAGWLPRGEVEGIHEKERLQAIFFCRGSRQMDGRRGRTEERAAVAVVGGRVEEDAPRRRRL